MEFPSDATASSVEELERFLDGLSDKILVITLVNSSYFTIFERWYFCFRSCSNHKLLVIALDCHVYRKINELGIECILFHNDDFTNFLSTKEFKDVERNLLSRLWALRWYIIERIILRGVEIIHSDADAIWLRNPVPTILSEPFDMAASLARRWPEDVVRKWGFVLCMGFFVLRPTESSIQLVQRIRISMQILDQDDQVTVNRLLLDAGASWRKLSSNNYNASVDLLNLSVTVIDSDLISRSSNDTPNVFHPYLRGNIFEKISKLDSGIHEIRSREGLQLSYYRRYPIPKMAKKKDSVLFQLRSLIEKEHLLMESEYLLFIHIPKAGGTSVQEMLSLPGRGHIRVKDVPDTAGAFIFSVCRNPYSRLVSAFHYLTDRSSLSKRDQIESMYIAPYVNNFRDFVIDIIGAIDIYRSIHLIPQHFFVCNENNIAVDEIIPLECLNEKVKSGTRGSGGNIEILHSNRSAHISADRYYDEQTRAIVARTYARDFEIFGYDPLLDADSAPHRKP